MQAVRNLLAFKPSLSSLHRPFTSTILPRSYLSISSPTAIKAAELTKENIPPCEGCPICSRNIKFKVTDVLFLSQFLTPEGYMINRRVSGICKPKQKKVFKFMHIARRIGLLPRKPPKDGEGPPEYGLHSKSQRAITFPSKFNTKRVRKRR